MPEFEKIKTRYNTKNGYEKVKEEIRIGFQDAYIFLIQLENLPISNEGVRINKKNDFNDIRLHIYCNGKFILYVSFSSHIIEVGDTLNGRKKVGYIDDSETFFKRVFIPKLENFRNDTSNTIEIYDTSCVIEKTAKSNIFFKILIDSILEYAEKGGVVDFNGSENEFLSELQTYVALDNSSDEKLLEGIQKTITATIYERNTKAREACLKYWNYSCAVCGFNFEKTYGELGKNYIHVHHVTPVSSIKKEYEINPIEDLRPVCPNCHSMIHRQKEALSIEELKKILAENRE